MEKRVICRVDMKQILLYKARWGVKSSEEKRGETT